MEDIKKVLNKALQQIEEHKQENHACERAIEFPPRKRLPGLVDDRVLSAANGIHLPWIAAAKATWQSNMEFSGVEMKGDTVGPAVDRLEDDLIRESRDISAALIETGFCAVVFGTTEAGEIRLRTYSGKDSTVVLDEWGDPEFGFLRTGRTGDLFEAEIHDKNSFRTVYYKQVDVGEWRVVREEEPTKHNLGICLVVPLRGDRIIGKEAVAIQGTANLVEAMSTASQALHTSPRELFGNVPMDAITGVRSAVVGSSLNGPVVLPRVPESRTYGSDEEKNLAANTDSPTELDTHEVKYQRSFGGDASASYAEQIKRIATSFSLSVPMPAGWASLTPGALNGILDSSTQAQMGERFFAATKRLNRQTSRDLSRALNKMLAALDQTDTKVDVVFGSRSAFEPVRDHAEADHAREVATFLVEQGLLQARTAKGASKLGKLFNLDAEFVSELQRELIQGRSERLLSAAEARAAEEAAAAVLEASEDLPEASGEVDTSGE